MKVGDVAYHVLGDIKIGGTKEEGKILDTVCTYIVFFVQRKS